MERLQKVMAASGVASRRECENIIRQGRVKVNGRIVTQLGMKVAPEDIVEVDNRKVGNRDKLVYLLLNKPAGYVTTVHDPQGRKTVLDLINVPQRVYPVGRLDYDTEGLLILTNDGDLTYLLTHPKHEVGKTYHALVAGQPTEQMLDRLRRGIMLDDGITAPAKVRIQKKIQGDTLLEIIIHEGRNRQVRRMCEAIGHPVLALKRAAIGDLVLGDLAPGTYRMLSKDRILQATATE